MRNRIERYIILRRVNGESHSRPAGDGAYSKKSEARGFVQPFERCLNTLF